MALALELADTTVYGFALHNHSGKAAKGVVVYTAPLVQRVITQVVDVYLHQPFLLRPAKNTLLSKALQQLGQYGYDVYSHIPIISFTLWNP